MKSAHFAALPLTVLILLLMTQLVTSIRDHSQNDQANPHLIKHNPKQDARQIEELLKKLEDSPGNTNCADKIATIEQLNTQLKTLREEKKSWEASKENIEVTIKQLNSSIKTLREANKNLEANKEATGIQLNILRGEKKNCQDKLEKESIRLSNTKNQLSKTQTLLEVCRAKKDCANCPEVKCPIITCPEKEQCKCQICHLPEPCKEPTPCPQCKKPTPCPQCKKTICPQIQCPPQIVCPVPKPCNCQICQQPIICPQPETCPQKQCPKIQPCPEINCKSICQAQILELNKLFSSKQQAFQLKYNKILKQRDDCLNDDSSTRCKQELIKFNDHLTAQLTQILQTIEETLLRSGQKLDFSNTKTFLDEIKTELQSRTQISWSESIADYRKISIKLLSQLDSVSSLTSEAIQLNSKYSHSIKSIRDKLAHCESLLR